MLDSGKEKMREENLIKEESKKEISLYKYNRESKNGNAGEKFFSALPKLRFQLYLKVEGKSFTWISQHRK